MSIHHEATVPESRSFRTLSQTGPVASALPPGVQHISVSHRTVAKRWAPGSFSGHHALGQGFSRGEYHG